MPTALSVGTTTFREVAVEEVHNKSGLDSLTVVLRGKATYLAAESALWTKGRSYTGYPNMALETKSVMDQGPVAEIALHFIGFISADTPENGLIDRSDAISLQSASLTSTEGDDVQFSYYGQDTTARWVSRASRAPANPRFNTVPPTSVPVGQLFNPFPASYRGSVAGQYKIKSRLSQFDRTRISPSMWTVIETWSLSIEPVASEE